MNLDRRRFLLALASASSAHLMSHSAQADDLSEGLAAITRSRASLKTLKARFRQERTIGLLATTVNSTGTLTLVRPDRLRWELDAPDAITYWIGPEGLAFKTAEGVSRLPPAAAGRFGSILADLMVMLGGDLKRLRKRYQLTISHHDQRWQLIARPSAPDIKKHLKSLTLDSGKAAWSVQRVEIQERNGDRSVINFEPASRNAAIPPAAMKPPR